MGCEADNRCKLEVFWDDNPPFALWLVFLLSGFAVWAHHHSIPGVSIGLLALMAGIVSLRPRMHFAEKVAWVLLFAVFTAFEVLVLTKTDIAATAEKKELTGKLESIKSSIDTTLSQINVIKDGVAVMLSNSHSTTTTIPNKTHHAPPVPKMHEPSQEPQTAGRRFVDAEKLGLYLKSAPPASSASVINDGTNEAGNLANQIVIGLIAGNWVAGGNNIKMGDPAFFPDPLTIEVSNARASANDYSPEEAKTLQGALKNQGVVAKIEYTQQAFPANFMRIKVAGR